MSLFDLLFLGLCLASIVTLLTAGVMALVGRFRRAGRIVTVWAALAVIYLVVVAAVSLVVPRRSVQIGEAVCFDDWCITVDGAEPANTTAPAGADVTYTVKLTLSSRARGIRQRENNVVVYLTDARSDRYDALPAVSDVPFNTQLGPGESARLTRQFKAPAAAQVGVVLAHEGGFPINWFILGQGPFHKPPVVWLPRADETP